jgi:hypothetical protein
MDVYLQQLFVPATFLWPIPELQPISQVRTEFSFGCVPLVRQGCVNQNDGHHKANEDFHRREID